MWCVTDADESQTGFEDVAEQKYRRLVRQSLSFPVGEFYKFEVTNPSDSW